MCFTTCDERRHRLLELIDELHGALQASKGKEAVVATFKSTIACAKTHFREEEKSMRTHGYPAIDDQKKAHELFIGEASNLFAQFKRGGILALSVGNFLKRVERHMLGDDREYCQYLSEKGMR